MASLINKQLLLTAYAYLFIMEQQKAQRESEALQLQTKGSGAPSELEQTTSSVETLNRATAAERVCRDQDSKGVNFGEQRDHWALGMKGKADGLLARFNNGIFKNLQNKQEITTQLITLGKWLKEAEAVLLDWNRDEGFEDAILRARGIIALAAFIEPNGTGSENLESLTKSRALDELKNDKTRKWKESELVVAWYAKLAMGSAEKREVDDLVEQAATEHIIDEIQKTEAAQLADLKQSLCEKHPRFRHSFIRQMLVWERVGRAVKGPADPDLMKALADEAHRTGVVPSQTAFERLVAFLDFIGTGNLADFRDFLKKAKLMINEPCLRGMINEPCLRGWYAKKGGLDDDEKAKIHEFINRQAIRSDPKSYGGREAARAKAEKDVRQKCEAIVVANYKDPKKRLKAEKALKGEYRDHHALIEQLLDTCTIGHLKKVIKSEECPLSVFQAVEKLFWDRRCRGKGPDGTHGVLYDTDQVTKADFKQMLPEAVDENTMLNFVNFVWITQEAVAGAPVLPYRKVALDRVREAYRRYGDLPEPIIAFQQHLTALTDQNVREALKKTTHAIDDKEDNLAKWFGGLTSQINKTEVLQILAVAEKKAAFQRHLTAPDDEKKVREALAKGLTLAKGRSYVIAHVDLTEWFGDQTSGDKTQVLQILELEMVIAGRSDREKEAVRKDFAQLGYDKKQRFIVREEFNAWKNKWAKMLESDSADPKKDMEELAKDAKLKLAGDDVLLKEIELTKNLWGFSSKIRGEFQKQWAIATDNKAREKVIEAMEREAKAKAVRAEVKAIFDNKKLRPSGREKPLAELKAKLKSSRDKLLFSRAVAAEKAKAVLRYQKQTVSSAAKTQQVASGRVAHDECSFQPNIGKKSHLTMASKTIEGDVFDRLTTHRYKIAHYDIENKQRRCF